MDDVAVDDAVPRADGSATIGAILDAVGAAIGAAVVLAGHGQQGRLKEIELKSSELIEQPCPKVAAA